MKNVIVIKRKDVEKRRQLGKEKEIYIPEKDLPIFLMMVSNRGPGYTYK